MVVCISSRGSKTFHRVDKPESIKIMYDAMSKSFLISFKEDHKQKLISLRRFDITGNCLYEFEK